MQNESCYATIIIDDPPLKENYGYLNYRKLLDLMDKYNFHTTIAFIPWNYNRTDKRIAALFRDRPDRFSLCIHGCDHTWGEFGKTDLKYLDNKIRLATTRMVEHEKRTGVRFDKIMIFPQGIFSNEAVDVLKNQCYLAVVNTTDFSVNGPLSSTFPFFLRYRPENIPDRIPNPMFIVLHQDYFKEGYERIADLVNGLNSRSDKLKWDSVGNIIRHYVTPHEAQPQGPLNADLRGLKVNGFKETIKIYLRRHASEFRDKYLFKNDFLLNCSKKMKTLRNRGY